MSEPPKRTRSPQLTNDFRLSTQLQKVGGEEERILDDSSLFRTTQTGHCKERYLFIFI